MPSRDRTGMARGRERQVTGSELKPSQLGLVSECEESWESSLEVKGMLTTHSQR